MFVGIQDFSSGYHREMGERPEDVARRPQRQNPYGNEYRGREMGERPEDVPSRSKQADNYARAERNNPSYSYGDSYSTRPREMGEKPEDVARSSHHPKTYDEMTEQERRLDLFA